jgi:hypothetical protein
MAAVAQGFSGGWRSGWPMFDAHLAKALGLRERDRIVGFLGTPTRTSNGPPVSALDDFVRHL